MEEKEQIKQYLTLVSVNRNKLRIYIHGGNSIMGKGKETRRLAAKKINFLKVCFQ